MTASIKALSDGLSGELQVNGSPSFRFGADTSGQLAGFRNKIINGNFDIWQRGTSFSTAAYSVDRWYFGFTGGTCSVAQGNSLYVGLADTGASKYFCTINTSGATQPGLTQAVEGVQTFSGRTVTLSYCHNQIDVPNPAIMQYFGTGGSPSATVNLTPTAVTTSPYQGFYRTVAQFSIPTVTGKTIGTNNNDYISVIINLPLTVSGMAIWSVQLEEGSIATPFEQRPIGLELSLCQRYYQARNFLSATAYGAASATQHILYPLGVSMRATPNAATLTGMTLTNCTSLFYATRLDIVSIGVTVTTLGNYNIANGAFTLSAEL